MTLLFSLFCFFFFLTLVYKECCRHYKIKKLKAALSYLWFSSPAPGCSVGALKGLLWVMMDIGEFVRSPEWTVIGGEIIIFYSREIRKRLKLTKCIYSLRFFYLHISQGCDPVNKLTFLKFQKLSFTAIVDLHHLKWVQLFPSQDVQSETNVSATPRASCTSQAHPRQMLP